MVESIKGKMSDVNLIWVTPEAEKVIGYCARVSNPSNQSNPDVAGLLRYCIREKHWSIFEMANACFEITTTLDISHQIVRHRSFTYQQLSRRYSSDGIDFDFGNPRRQDTKNRQNSIDDLSDEDKHWFHTQADYIKMITENSYSMAIERGIAKECARKLLPVASTTRLYMNGTIRSWLHYCDLRCGNGTQKEHQEIAFAIREILCSELPTVA
jgi:thymidylate synthase (FAD)